MFMPGIPFGCLPGIIVVDRVQGSEEIIKGNYFDIYTKMRATLMYECQIVLEVSICKLKE